MKQLPRLTDRLYLSAPHMSGQEKELLIDAFDSNWIAPLGPHVNAFEYEFAVQTARKHAVATSSGTAALHLALHLALRLLEVGSDDDVIVSTFTFVASANAVIYQGARPVFIDSDQTTWNLAPQLLHDELKRAAAAGKLPKAIIVVDVLEQCADYEPIMEIARRFDVPVIEDAAEALGASYQGRPARSATWPVFPSMATNLLPPAAVACWSAIGKSGPIERGIWQLRHENRLRTMNTMKLATTIA